MKPPVSGTRGDRRRRQELASSKCGRRLGSRYGISSRWPGVGVHLRRPASKVISIGGHWHVYKPSGVRRERAGDETRMAGRHVCGDPQRAVPIGSERSGSSDSRGIARVGWVRATASRKAQALIVVASCAIWQGRGNDGGRAGCHERRSPGTACMRLEYYFTFCYYVNRVSGSPRDIPVD